MNERLGTAGKRVELRRGDSFILLRLLGRMAIVIGGNAHRVGDLVELPDGSFWSEVEGKTPMGETSLAPNDLLTVFDSGTGWFYLSTGKTRLIPGPVDEYARSIDQAIGDQKPKEGFRGEAAA